MAEFLLSPGVSTGIRIRYGDYIKLPVREYSVFPTAWGVATTAQRLFPKEKATLHIAGNVHYKLENRSKVARTPTSL